MFKKNYLFIGHREGDDHPLVISKWNVSKKELSCYLAYIKCNYKCYAIEYYTVKRKDWYK
jgi:hypothetical protein